MVERAIEPRRSIVHALVRRFPHLGASEHWVYTDVRSPLECFTIAHVHSRPIVLNLDGAVKPPVTGYIVMQRLYTWVKGRHGRRVVIFTVGRCSLCQKILWALEVPSLTRARGAKQGS
jgi:hypothetical protein